jgi:hypothetical protein
VLLSIVPFCALLGYITPQLVDAVAAGEPGRAGRAYAVNVMGCIVGPLVAGYVLLPWLGVKGATVLLSGCLLLLLVSVLRRWRVGPLLRAGTVAATVLLLVAALVAARTLEEGEYAAGSELRRDHTATVISAGRGMDRKLLVNGIGITGLTPITKMMAHLPLAHLEHPPRRVLVICFGMGTTFRSALSWGGEVWAAELVPSVRDAFGYYHEDAATLLALPRAHVVIDDGRRFLARTPLTFDVITIDPPPPVEAAGSSLLYSREMYALVRQHLAPGGVLQQWLPPAGDPVIDSAVLRSLVESFPHVRLFGSVEAWGTHYLASMQPIPRRSAEELAARLPPPAASDLGEWFAPGTPASLAFAGVLRREHSVTEILASGSPTRISDDRPLNEYYLLRRRLGLPVATR